MRCPGLDRLRFLVGIDSFFKTFGKPTTSSITLETDGTGTDADVTSSKDTLFDVASSMPPTWTSSSNRESGVCALVVWTSTTSDTMRSSPKMWPSWEWKDSRLGSPGIEMGTVCTEWKGKGVGEWGTSWKGSGATDTFLLFGFEDKGIFCTSGDGTYVFLWGTSWRGSGLTDSSVYTVAGAKACGGITCMSYGQIPVNLNPWRMLSEVTAFSQAVEKSFANVAFTTTFPGLCDIKSEQAILKAFFNGPKTPLSSGWSQWDEWGGKAMISIPSIFASLSISVTSWLWWPSIMRTWGRAGPHCFRNISISI